MKLGCRFVLARKPGKLPSETITEEYQLEYGVDSIEIHRDDISKGDRILIVMIFWQQEAPQELRNIIKKLDGEIVSYAFLITLKFHTWKSTIKT